METNPTPTGTTIPTPTPAKQLLPGETKLGAVHLDVTDGEQARTFWTQYVGLTENGPSDDSIRLGIDGQDLVVLHPGAAGTVVSRRTGLYHVAIHVPSQKELARLVARLFSLSFRNSPTDHAETMATYFSDPDGNGIEITFETPTRGALVQGDGSGLAVMADGTTQGPTEALNLDLLMSALSKDDDLMAPMPSGARIGHVHLHVRNLAESREFYRDVIGFGDLRAMDSWGMSDLSLETSYVPHALAVNVWNGPNAAVKPEGTAGLRHWTILVPDENALRGIEKRLTGANTSYDKDENGVRVNDPSGNPLAITIQG